MTAYFNEFAPYPARVLRARIVDGLLPDGEVDERDVRSVDPRNLAEYDQIHLFAGVGGLPYGLRLAGWPDDRPILTAGFPCQPVSHAGKRLGQADARWLWPEVARILRVVRPPTVLLENVPGLLGRGLSDVLGDFAALGFDARWEVISAAEVGAPHIRKRIWILAYPSGLADVQAVAPVGAQRGERITRNNAGGLSWPTLAGSHWDIYQPPPVGVDDGLPSRMDRGVAMGNGVVPQSVVEVIVRWRQEGLL